MKKYFFAALLSLGFSNLFAQANKVYTVTVKDNGVTEYNEAMIFYEQKEFAKAIPLFEKSAEKGNDHAMFMMGVMYKNGKGVAVSTASEMEWYLKAADKNNPAAMFNIAAMYMDGAGVPPNKTLALEWAEKAANLGHVQSMINLAMEAYESKDYTKTFEWMGKAAATGDADAMSNFGTLYANGVGTTRDYNLAAQWWKRAADAGDPGAMMNLGNFYEASKQQSVANEWFTKSANLGNIKASTHLAWKAYDLADYKTALEWFHKAIGAGDVQSLTVAGILYCNGQGTEKNVQRGYELWLAAAKQNEPTAAYNIGKLYEDKILPNSSMEKAVEWYKKAASLGYEDATRRLKELGY